MQVEVDPFDGELELVVGSGGGGGGANCATAPTLLCLAGRTGSTNNPTISSDSDGTITGSATTSHGLFLTSNPVDVATPMVAITPNAFAQDRIMVGPGTDPTTSLFPGGFLSIGVTAQFGGIPAIAIIGAGGATVPPTLVGIGSNGTLAAPTAGADGDILLQTIVGGYDATNALIFGSASFSFAQAGAAQTGFQATQFFLNTTDDTGNNETRIFIDHLGRVGFNETGPVGPDHSVTVKANLYCGPNVTSTTTEAALQAWGDDMNPRAIVPPLLTDTGEAAFSDIVAGMIFYNTTNNVFRGRINNVWSTFVSVVA